MSKIVKTWDGHQGELLYIKGKIAFIKESNGEVWFCLKTDIIDFDEINMEEYYVKDAGKITYIYGVDLEEHKTVIEKQQKRIAELEQELAELKEKAIVPKFKISQKIWHILCNDGASCVAIEDVITNIKGNIYSLKNCRFCAMEEELFATEQEAQEKLKEIQGNE